MEKPKKYSIKDLRTGEWEETNLLPPSHMMQAYVAKPDKPNVGILTKVKEVYEDTRYEAKLRLYNYVTYTRNGLPIPNTGEAKEQFVDAVYEHLHGAGCTK